MWWQQLCAWVASQCEEESISNQIQWKSPLSNIPEEAQSQDVYTAFLHDWRKLIAEDDRTEKDEFALAYKQKMLSVIDCTLAYIAKG